MRLIKILSLAFILSSGLASARLPEPFTPENFEASKKEGKVILLHFFADWCPSCRAQKKVMDSILSERELNEIVFLRVDYDNALRLRKEFKVNRQSTLIVLRGEREVARKAGITDKDEIRDYLIEATAAK
jgi:thioredoxin 1